MKKIVTIAAVAALATLSACNKAEEAPAANEAVSNEATVEVGKPADEIVGATAPTGGSAKPSETGAEQPK